MKRFGKATWQSKQCEIVAGVLILKITKNTQTVERSHSSVKMRLRCGRGVFRQNIQPIMDFEDFISNRTTGKSSPIFKVLGDTARLYSSAINDTIVRTSNIPLPLSTDCSEHVEGLT